MPLPVSVRPYVVTALSGIICGAAAPPTRIFRKTEGSIRSNAVGQEIQASTQFVRLLHIVRHQIFSAL